MTQTFGSLLKQLRKRAGMTQHDLAAATGYSRALISALEQSKRLPDIAVVGQSFVPALGLQAEPHLAARMIELAALARGERPPPSLTLTRERHEGMTAQTMEVLPLLPIPPTALIGRDQEISYLCQRLQGHQGRLLTLVGPPGVGKTRLAQAVLAELQRMYQDGALFVSLAAVNDPMLVASTVLAALKLPDGSSKPPQTRLIEYLRHKQMILLLDNFEQIVAAAPLLAELLVECAGLRLLVTSRERLHLRAEQRYKVLPLALAAAVELFVQRAQSVDTTFSLTAHNRPTLEAICARLDCLPLAIELCAAHIEFFTPAQLLDEMQAHPLDLLVQGAHDFPPHHRTLRAAIQRSYQLLADEERALLRGLSVFAGGFALPEVEAVMEERFKPEEQRLNDKAVAQSLASILRALVSKSLVHSQTSPAGEQRFLLLETIREFGLEQVRTQGEEAWLRQRHYAAYRHLCRTADSYLRGPKASYWFQRLDVELENLRAALQWALESGHYSDLAWMGVALFWFWSRRGHVREAMLWMEPLLPHRHTLSLDLRLAYLHVIFTSWAVLGEFRRAEQHKPEIVQLAQRCGHQNLRAATLLAVAVSTPQFTEAAAAFEKAIALARHIREPQGLPDEFCIIGNDAPHLLASALHWYGELRLGRGDYERAAELCAESLTILRAMGNCDTIAYPLGNLGRLALIRGDVASAHEWIAEAVSISQAIGNKFGLAYWLPWLGKTKFYLGETEIAWQIFDQARQLCFEIAYHPILPNIATGLAIIALHRANFNQAEQMIGEALAGFSKTRWITAEVIDGLLTMARLATLQQQFIRAATLFGLVDQLQTQIHQSVEAPMRPLVDAALATVQAALAPEVFADAFAAGQQLSLEEAFAAILTPSHLDNSPSLRL